MKERNGWTLLELLVAMAIVGLLLSISLPALRRARLQARAVICLSRLRQLGNATVAWADENGGCTVPSSRRWQAQLRLHSLGERNEVLFCPMAARFVSEGGRQPFAAYNAFSFGDFLSTTVTGGVPDTFSTHDVYSGYGSYGLNGSASNPSAHVQTNPSGYPTANHWRCVAVKGASTVPLLADAMWVDGFPHHTDEPPECGDAGPSTSYTGTRGQMGVFCLNRHDGCVNVVFLDLAARRVGLKELWKLKWHREYDLNAPVPKWPGWMKGLRDY